MVNNLHIFWIISIGLVIGCNNSTSQTPIESEPKAIEKADETGLTEFKMTGSSAEHYKLTVEPYIFAPWAKDLVKSAGLKDGESLLDLGCGTGVVAREAFSVSPSTRIVGLDIGQAALDVAKASSPTQNIEWKLGDSQALPFSSEEFDVVLSQQMLQFVPDKKKAVAELKRVLKPNGRYYVSVWTRPSPGLYIDVVAKVVERDVSLESRKVVEGSYRGVKDDYQTLFGDEFEDVTVDIVKKSLPIEKMREFIRGHIEGFAMRFPDEEMRQTAKIDKVVDAILKELQMGDGPGELLTESLVIYGRKK